MLSLIQPYKFTRNLCSNSDRGILLQTFSLFEDLLSQKLLNQYRLEYLITCFCAEAALEMMKVYIASLPVSLQLSLMLSWMPLWGKFYGRFFEEQVVPALFWEC